MIGKCQTVVLVICFAGFSVCADLEEEDHVLLLTKDNFDAAVAENEYIMIEFHAPWCSLCSVLDPVLTLAATTLVEDGIPARIGKVDCTIEIELQDRFGITGYPTIKLFKKGKSSEYEGGREASDIVKWLKKKTGPAAKTYEVVEYAAFFVKKHDVAIMGFFNDMETESAKAFMQVAKDRDDLPFGVTSNADVFADNGVEGDTVVLFKKFDEGRNDLTSDLTVDGIDAFIRTNHLPTVLEFSHEAAVKIFNGNTKAHLFLLISEESDDFDNSLEIYREAALGFKGRVQFVYVNIDADDHRKMLGFFGMGVGDCPAVRFIILGDEVSKFKPERADLDSVTIRTFVSDVLDGKLKPHLLSQEVPDDWDSKPVKVLVGKNFAEVTKNKSRNVFVEFYAPTCGRCRLLAPIWEELAEKFKDNEELTIAKIDFTANEVQGIKIQGYPALKYFRKDNDEIVDYNGAGTLEALSTFLESGGEVQIPEEGKEDGSRKDEL